MVELYRSAMDKVYLVCVIIAGVALVVISLIMPWAVFTRYVLNSAASWPETAAVLLTIVLTFFGAAACYRLGLHMNVTVAADMLSPKARRVSDFIVELLMLGISLFMVVYGIKLCQATWQNTIAEFPFLSVGLVYSPIPIGGAFTVLFIVERFIIGRPVAEADPHIMPVE